MLTNQQKSSGKIRIILITIAISYLFLILLAPAVNVFWQAFSKGFGPFLEVFSQADFISAVGLTFFVAAIVVPINSVFGLCAAWAIARHRFFGRSLVISLLDLPFSISPVVAGVMMILLYGNRGWFGGWLSTVGVKVIFGVPGIIIATAFVTMPFVAREVIPVLEEIGPEQEEAARTLGAKDWQIFWHVTLPNIRWGLLYGVILTNARAMGEFGAVSVVSGNIARKTQTLPLFVEESYKQYATTSAFAASVLLALLGLVTLVLKLFLERQLASKQKDD
ncbi:sulfate ABC transporter permease subunit CysW [filamentous cyanobacterium LEGE 11480]|uniref:Sulfate ABC transporter permease subunit CysW n=1 Tax=Romeriopsis navalis LEGE 11480 TaxID=2777977 RepID=A0A928Z6B9_9CYAN|nr:sulfate ABC transporter permease subunit CysW [Romeriopsis navalis]MBE9032463.1 sulfate ABC transporter permease subunit CysW [Romeriopsis navalis LEGE 11480]